MNEQEGELNATQALCWSCKYGICIQESERELVMPTNEEQPQDTDETWRGSPPQQGTGPIVIEHDQIRTICFWRPEHIKDAPPIMVGNVKQCNRFVANE